MMKNSTLLKWTNNVLNNKNNKNANKNWIHPPEALQGGHIAYLVKFLGTTEVSQSKGIEVVKEAIIKLKFNQLLKKSEGTKIPKVDLTISIDGVAVQQPKTKKILHQYPLHRISYCADDKAEKRFFSFIAKEGNSDCHSCFVFVSDKLAEEITLTIGQAFDLAYRQFLETSSREIELRRQIVSLQHQLQSAQSENNTLKSKLNKISNVKNQEDLNQYLSENHMRDVSSAVTIESSGQSGEEEEEGEEMNNNTNDVSLPPVPPRSIDKLYPVVDDLLASPNHGEENDDDFDPRAGEDVISVSPGGGEGAPGDGNDFDPRAEEIKVMQTFSNEVLLSSNGTSPVPLLLPPPRPSLQSQPPSAPRPPDYMNSPFSFQSNSDDEVLAQLNEMKVGFSQGLSFGTADVDLTLDSLDPFKN